MSAKSSKWVRVAAGTAAAAIVGRMLLQYSRSFSFHNKVVLITGGSRGLGLVIARHLVQAGAKVAICARDEQEIRRAVFNLEKFGSEVIGIRCDVRDPKQVRQCMNQIIRKWDHLDVLFNVAGVIEVGPVETMTLDDFYNSMQTNCWGALHTCMAAHPIMRHQGWGRIVNIASLGGKRAVPHMTPYAASKFALVGLSTGLRAEYKKDGILVTTVCPGLMRTGSPRNATFKGQHRKEYAWFSISDSLPLISMSVDAAAKKIIRSCQRGDAEVVVGGGGILANVQQLAPNIVSEVLSLVNTYLLPRTGGIGKRPAFGYESNSPMSPSFLTALGDEAAAENNEVTPL